MNKKEKAYIIFRRIVISFMQLGAIWVIGMSLVLLTTLYVDSELPNNAFFAILWLAGCIEILFDLIRPGDKVRNIKKRSKGK